MPPSQPKLDLEQLVDMKAHLPVQLSSRQGEQLVQLFQDMANAMVAVGYRGSAQPLLQAVTAAISRGSIMETVRFTHWRHLIRAAAELPGCSMETGLLLDQVAARWTDLHGIARGCTDALDAEDVTTLLYAMCLALQQRAEFTEFIKKLAELAAGPLRGAMGCSQLARSLCYLAYLGCLDSSVRSLATKVAEADLTTFLGSDLTTLLYARSIFLSLSFHQAVSSGHSQLASEPQLNRMAAALWRECSRREADCTWRQCCGWDEQELLQLHTARQIKDACTGRQTSLVALPSPLSWLPSGPAPAHCESGPSPQAKLDLEQLVAVVEDLPVQLSSSEGKQLVQLAQDMADWDRLEEGRRDKLTQAMLRGLRVGAKAENAHQLSMAAWSLVRLKRQFPPPAATSVFSAFISHCASSKAMKWGSWCDWGRLLHALGATGMRCSNCPDLTRLCDQAVLPGCRIETRQLLAQFAAKASGDMDRLIPHDASDLLNAMHLVQWPDMDLCRQLAKQVRTDRRPLVISLCSLACLGYLGSAVCDLAAKVAEADLTAWGARDLTNLLYAWTMFLALSIHRAVSSGHSQLASEPQLNSMAAALWRECSRREEVGQQWSEQGIQWLRLVAKALTSQTSSTESAPTADGCVDYSQLVRALAAAGDNEVEQAAVSLDGTSCAQLVVKGLGLTRGIAVYQSHEFLPDGSMSGAVAHAKLQQLAHFDAGVVINKTIFDQLASDSERAAFMREQMRASLPEAKWAVAAVSQLLCICFSSIRAGQKGTGTARTERAAGKEQGGGGVYATATKGGSGHGTSPFPTIGDPGAETLPRPSQGFELAGEVEETPSMPHTDTPAQALSNLEPPSQAALDMMAAMISRQHERLVQVVQDMADWDRLEERNMDKLTEALLRCLGVGDEAHEYANQLSRTAWSLVMFKHKFPPSTATSAFSALIHHCASSAVMKKGSWHAWGELLYAWDYAGMQCSDCPELTRLCDRAVQLLPGKLTKKLSYQDICMPFSAMVSVGYTGSAQPLLQAVTAAISRGQVMVEDRLDADWNWYWRKLIMAAGELPGCRMETRQLLAQFAAKASNSLNSMGEMAAEDVCDMLSVMRLAFLAFLGYLDSSVRDLAAKVVEADLTAFKPHELTNLLYARSMFLALSFHQAVSSGHSQLATQSEPSSQAKLDLEQQVAEIKFLPLQISNRQGKQLVHLALDMAEWDRLEASSRRQLTGALLQCLGVGDEAENAHQLSIAALSLVMLKRHLPPPAATSAFTVFIRYCDSSEAMKKGSWRDWGQLLHALGAAGMQCSDCPALTSLCDLAVRVLPKKPIRTLSYKDINMPLSAMVAVGYTGSAQPILQAVTAAISRGRIMKTARFANWRKLIMAAGELHGCSLETRQLLAQFAARVSDSLDEIDAEDVSTLLNATRLALWPETEFVKQLAVRAAGHSRGEMDSSQLAIRLCSLTFLGYLDSSVRSLAIKVAEADLTAFCTRDLTNLLHARSMFLALSIQQAVSSGHSQPATLRQYNPAPRPKQDLEQLVSAVEELPFLSSSSQVKETSQLLWCFADWARQPENSRTHMTLAQHNAVMALLQRMAGGAGDSKAVSPPTPSPLQQFDARQLNMAAWSLGKLKPHLPAAAATLACTAIASHSASSEAMRSAGWRDWSNLLHGLATAGMKCSDSSDLTWLCDQAVQLLPEKLAWGAASQAISMTLWAMAKSGYTGSAQPLLQSVTAAISQGEVTRDAEPGQWASLIWAASKLPGCREGARQLLDQFAARAKSVVPGLRTQEACTIMYAMSLVLWHDKEVCMLLAERAAQVQQVMNGQDRTNSLYGLARLGYLDYSVRSLAAGVAKADLAAFTTQHLTNLLYARTMFLALSIHKAVSSGHSQLASEPQLNSMAAAVWRECSRRESVGQQWGEQDLLQLYTASQWLHICTGGQTSLAASPALQELVLKAAAFHKSNLGRFQTACRQIDCGQLVQALTGAGHSETQQAALSQDGTHCALLLVHQPGVKQGIAVEHNSNYLHDGSMSGVVAHVKLQQLAHFDATAVVNKAVFDQLASDSERAAFMREQVQASLPEAEAWRQLLQTEGEHLAGQVKAPAAATPAAQQQQAVIVSAGQQARQQGALPLPGAQAKALGLLPRPVRPRV
ncbi:hypothetical protein QJQ45_013430 [Haematococcus lacustris]|nr:hypothetical protein QJQ45_013430 [Haematococcus lacustris]